MKIETFIGIEIIAIVTISIAIIVNIRGLKKTNKQIEDLKKERGEGNE